MENYINNTSLVYNKNGFTTGIVFRIQEYILFSFKLNNIVNTKLLNIIFPSGILNWNYVAQYIIDQLNEYSSQFNLNTLFSYELTNLNLRIKAKPDNTIVENSITFNTSRFNLDINNIFLDLKPTIRNNNNDIIFKINNSITDYYLYYDFNITTNYNLNDLYLMTTYHNIDNTTLQQKVICKFMNSQNTINEKILDFTIIGFDIPSDLCISKYSNIEETFSIENIISNYFTWPIDNVWYHYFNKNLLIQKNSKNSQSSFMYYPQLIPIGSEIYIIGNSEYDNNCITSGVLCDNSFSGLYENNPIVESLLVNSSSYKGYSGGPILTNMLCNWNIDYMMNNVIDICLSYNGQIVYVLIYRLSKYFLFKSLDYGKKFKDISFADLNINTNKDSTLRLCVDNSGLHVYLSISNNGFYYSSDQGLNWTIKSSITLLRCIDCSYDGTTVMASGSGSILLYSYNYGTTITQFNINTPLILNLIKISDTTIIAAEPLGYLYISDVKNINLVTKLNDKKRLWSSIDNKNKIMCATTQRGEVYISYDDGLNFSKIVSLPFLNYTSVSIDKKGLNIIISGNSFKDTINMDSVINSEAIVGIGVKVGEGIKAGLTGDLKINSSYIYISNNSGKNWIKDYSTDVIYMFNKIVISGDYKNIIAFGKYNLKYETSTSINYFIQSFINNNNYNIIGMLTGSANNTEYLENVNIGLSFHIIHFVTHQIYYKYLELDTNIKKDINSFTKYVISGFPKVYLGIKYTHFSHNDIIKNPSLITVFNIYNIFGGLWMNDFIKGFNFVKKQYIYNLLEREKKDTISIQNPLIYTKLWKIFHQDLSSKFPILLTKIIYFNFWIRQNIMLELGKFNSLNLKTQYDYYDINRERKDTISFVKSDYFSSQRGISDFIYFYYWDILGGLSAIESPIYNDFVIEYVYFDINKQIWTIGSEKVSPFYTDTREISIKYPVLLYGYEKTNTLYEFSTN